MTFRFIGSLDHPTITQGNTMGIKFRCPNGHKLNVKAHQAGKKGYCPKCKTQVNIPLKSTRKGKAEREAERLAAEAQATAPTSVGRPRQTVGAVH